MKLPGQVDTTDTSTASETLNHDSTACLHGPAVRTGTLLLVKRHG